jgi:hypothetical protein
MIRYVLYAAIVLVSACATSSQVVVGQARAPIDPANVKIYLTAPPGAKHIAILDASSGSSLAFSDQQKLDAAITELKKRAARLGANGVLIQGTGTESTAGVVVSQPTAMGYYAGARHKVVSAIAIYVDEE